MPRFTVIWESEVLDELARIWIDATDRHAAAIASDAIDVELSVNPFEKGAHLKEGLLALSVSPLRVVFEIHPEDRTVKVVKVKTLPS